MEPLKLRIYPDPILEVPCAPVPEVTDDIRALAAEMIDLMIVSDGVGLAAPQVGHSVRLFVVDIWWPETGRSNKALTFINPVLSGGTGHQKMQEGCLSLPSLREYIPRFAGIHVEALGLDGKTFTLDATGFLAIAIQHENDHLEGTLMIDRIGPLARRMALKSFR